MEEQPGRGGSPFVPVTQLLLIGFQRRGLCVERLFQLMCVGGERRVVSPGVIDVRVCYLCACVCVCSL